VNEPFEPLLETGVDPDPLVQFGRWFDDAGTVVANPEAMAVACECSMVSYGQPNARANRLTRVIPGSGSRSCSRTRSRRAG